MSCDVEIVVVEVPRAEIAYVKFILESYEGVAVTRTLDRRRALLALLIAPDFLDTANTVLAALADEIGCRVVPRPASLVDVLDDGAAPVE